MSYFYDIVYGRKSIDKWFHHEILKTESGQKSISTDNLIFFSMKLHWIKKLEEICCSLKYFNWLWWQNVWYTEKVKMKIRIKQNNKQTDKTKMSCFMT